MGEGRKNFLGSGGGRHISEPKKAYENNVFAPKKILEGTGEGGDRLGGGGGGGPPPCRCLGITYIL